MYSRYNNGDMVSRYWDVMYSRIGNRRVLPPGRHHVVDTGSSQVGRHNEQAGEVPLGEAIYARDWPPQCGFEPYRKCRPASVPAVSAPQRSVAKVVVAGI